MAWNDDPLVRDLADYCNKHEFPVGIFWGITKDSKQCQLVSYGRNHGLCKEAKSIGNKVLEAIFEEPPKGAK